MSTKTKTIERNGSQKSASACSIWSKAITANSEWPDKEEFLDVIYWSRQAIGIIVGIVWGLIPIKGFLGLILFMIVNAAIIYFYYSNFQNIDEEEYGGAWELTKEGFMTSFAGFFGDMDYNILWYTLRLALETNFIIFTPLTSYK